MSISDDETIANAQKWDAEAREAWAEGDFTRSQQLFEKVLAAWRSLARTEEIVYALFHITQAMRLKPDYNPSLARPFLEEALRLAEQIGTERYMKTAQFNLASLDFDSGDYTAALTKMQQLLPYWVQLPDPGGTCLGLEIIAKALIKIDWFEPGLRLYAAAAANREKNGMQHTVAAYLAQEERFLNPARSKLGAAQRAAAEAEGRKLTLEQAVAYAVSLSPKK